MLKLWNILMNNILSNFVCFLFTLYRINYRMVKRLILMMSVGFLLAEENDMDVLTKEIQAYSDSIKLLIPIGSSVYIAEHSDFNGKTSYFGKYFADQLAEYLSNSDQYEIVDRNSIQIYMDYENLQYSGVIDHRMSDQIEEIAGADIIITGTITEFEKTLKITSEIATVRDSYVIADTECLIKKTDEVAKTIALIMLKVEKDKKDLKEYQKNVYEEIEEQRKRFINEVENFRKEKISELEDEYTKRIKVLLAQQNDYIESFESGDQKLIKKIVNLKEDNNTLYSLELNNMIAKLEDEFEEKFQVLKNLRTKQENISTIDSDIEKLHQKIDKVSGKLSLLKMGMTVDDVRYIMGDRFIYNGICGNFGKYVLVFSNRTLIKACKIGDIYTQFGDTAIVNDCHDCDDMEVKNLIKY